ncbi:class I adenylate-forming enzyme family protein [Nocardia jiangxiensis]|uniref:Class I adenylate-forming enzyme family protein n=1 Tax=Nocardia jiangxiensis TaxID=282685 RepID=A0ABW6RUC3_9NOCA|nr:AMP-binding protein [Nocardia jiangxiensis]
MEQHSDTFSALWDATVSNHSNRNFLVFEDEDGTTSQWTYREFDAVVERASCALADHGVRAGTAIHLALRNCPAFLAVWLAAARLGAWFVPADPASSARDIANQVQRTRPALGICAAARAQTYRSGAPAGEFPIIELSETAADLGNGPLTAAARNLASPPRARVSPGDRLAVMFTSGTTSQPKGVVLTQNNYVRVAQDMSSVIALRAEHRWLVTLPLFHANAQYYCFAPAIAVGASVALTAKFSASQWVRQAADLRATHASLFAAPIRMILARTPARIPALALEHVWFAQSLGVEHHEEFTRLVGCRPRQLYGMTETVAAVTADVSEPLRHDVIGRPFNGRAVAVVDARTRTGTVIDGPGLLLVRGTRGVDLFSEYLDDPEVTAASFADDGCETWFATGDLVTIDREGVLRFVGRADDVVKVAGENVSLTEIESVLAQAPGVLEAAVLAEPDPIRDRVLIAYVVPRDPAAPPEAELLAEWAVSHLTPQARPRRWHVIDSLPRTSVGKVRRFKISAP